MEMVRKYTNNDVDKAIKKLFLAQDYDYVLSLVNKYGQDEYENEPQRVRLAILKLSAGDKSELLKMLELAKIDYRDVLLSAEYIKDDDKDGKFKDIDEPYSDLLS